MNRLWKLNIIDYLFLPRDKEEILKIPIFSNLEPDMRIWRYTSFGEFSVKKRIIWVFNIWGERCIKKGMKDPQQILGRKFGKEFGSYKFPQRLNILYERHVKT